MIRTAPLRSALAVLLLIASSPVPGALAQGAPSAPPPQGAPAPAPAHQGLRERFAAADADHDGHLTLTEAQAAGMRGVVRNFDAIDVGHKGYVTLDDIRAFHRARRAAAGLSRTPGSDQFPNGSRS